MDSVDRERIKSDEGVVALTRYQNIINTPESGELDYDSVDSGATKPSKAAVRVNDLLETVTGTEAASNTRLHH